MSNPIVYFVVVVVVVYHHNTIKSFTFVITCLFLLSTSKQTREPSLTKVNPKWFISL